MPALMAWRVGLRAVALLLARPDWAGTLTLAAAKAGPIFRHGSDSTDAIFEGPFLAETPAGTRLRVASWNVAAVNNNPFEYWITHPRPEYKQLMEGVEEFIIAPGNEDIRVDELFTDAMFRKVVDRCRDVGMPELATVERMWEESYRSRRVVSEFLTDEMIGRKRLASMPDRVTNTIQLPSGTALFRPAVVNCYGGDLSKLDQWFDKWLAFIFDQTVDLDGKGSRPVWSLLQKIKHAKYPDVTLEEEAASIPLQILVQGVFDAILVSFMQRTGGSTWQSLRREICESLNSRKNERVLDILQGTYADADVIFLQEVGNQLVGLLQDRMSSTYRVVVPQNYNKKRNQNSLMLLRSSVFTEAPKELDVPADGWEAGDLLAVTTVLDGWELTLASFHGDTNGLLTVPALDALVAVHPGHQPMLFGLDANTYAESSKTKAFVLEFERHYRLLGFRACWGKVDTARHTTFNARTYLQPQLNKAARSTELAAKGDRNPKDFVLFTRQFTQGRVWRDNTGSGQFLEENVFPTLEFPSDHAVISSDLLLEPPANTEL